MPSFSKYASVTLNTAGEEQFVKQLRGSILNSRIHPHPEQLKGGGGPMASNTSMYARQYHAGSAEHGNPESGLSRRLGKGSSVENRIGHQ
jgi:hypothetical protein